MKKTITIELTRDELYDAIVNYLRANQRIKADVVSLVYRGPCDEQVSPYCAIVEFQDAETY